MIILSVWHAGERPTMFITLPHTHRGHSELLNIAKLNQENSSNSVIRKFWTDSYIIL